MIELHESLETFWLYAYADNPVVLYDEFITIPDEIREPLLKAGLFKEGPPSTFVECDGCYDGHVAEVMPMAFPDGKRRFFISCPECLSVEVDPKRLRQWIPNFNAITELLHRSLNCQGMIRAVLPDRLWNVGRAAIAGQSRPVWLVRQLTSEMVEHLPQGKQPILFVIAPMYHQNQYFDPDRTFEMNQIANLDEGILRLDVEAVHVQLGTVVQSIEPSKKPIKRRSRRAGTIDALKKVIRAEILSRKSLLIQKWDEQLPPPEQKYFAAQIEVSPTAVSRALGDDDRELQILWQVVNDPRQIIKFNG